MQVPVVEVKARRVGGSTYQVPLKLVVLEQQIYLYVGLFNMLIKELEEVCQLN
jgi:ribosomal protein S7